MIEVYRPSSPPSGIAAAKLARMAWITARDVSEFVRGLAPTDLRLVALLFLSASLITSDPPPLSPRGLAARHHSQTRDRALVGSSGEPAEGADKQGPGGLGSIDGLVASAIAENKLPGCVVTIGRHDRVLFQKAYGLREVDPELVPMTEDTLFDLASLTKPIATATSLMILVEGGLVALDDPAANYVPEFAQHGKEKITLRQLLTHVSGLPAETPIDDYKHGRDEALRRIFAVELKAPPGTKFIYSDIGFLVLEEVLRRVTGRDLDAFAHDAIFAPLGMNETGFLPSLALKQRAAPTEVRDGAWIVGEVHDPRAFRIGGVAGHAGLFSTASDLVRYAQAILGGGSRQGVSILSEESTRRMMAPHDVPGGIRALGWDVKTPFSTNRGETLSRRSVGHGGYTGTSLWMDPEADLFVLFLSNRVHPDGKGSVNALAGQIGSIAAEAFGPPAEGRAAELPAGPTELGIDVLRREQFARLKGAHVGLVTNESGRASDGARTIDLLKHAPDVTLVAIFAPEHGLGANLDRKVENSNDRKTQLPIYSLYGDVFAPTDAMLAGIDTLAFDIQDAGARFFTYASTMHRTLRLAADRHLRVMVLDRPNPIDGVDVAGPVLLPEAISFVNHHPLPIRHGMTLGELAEMIDADEHLGARLEVVRMRGWKRTAYFDQTGLDWTPPSPNLRTVAEAVLYPGVALVEGTNVSVGRGTATPFELIGAPWMDDRLAAALQAQGLAGVVFTSAHFTPEKSVYAGEGCHGVRIEVIDRAAFDPIRMGIAIASSLQELYENDWHSDKLDQIVGNKMVTDAILARRPLAEIEALFSKDLDVFRNKRKKYFLYPDTEECR
jgi:uncharacterized protein YbbC (DUF1343 family)/CubicO group peptidase (beta-lactamase class C family)